MTVLDKKSTMSTTRFIKRVVFCYNESVFKKKMLYGATYATRSHVVPSHNGRQTIYP